MLTAACVIRIASTVAFRSRGVRAEQGGCYSWGSVFVSCFEQKCKSSVSRTASQLPVPPGTRLGSVHNHLEATQCLFTSYCHQECVTSCSPALTFDVVGNFESGHVVNKICRRLGSTQENAFGMMTAPFYLTFHVEAVLELTAASTRKAPIKACGKTVKPHLKIKLIVQAKPLGSNEVGNFLFDRLGVWGTLSNFDSHTMPSNNLCYSGAHGHQSS